MWSMVYGHYLDPYQVDYFTEYLRKAGVLRVDRGKGLPAWRSGPVLWSLGNLGCVISTDRRSYLLGQVLAGQVPMLAEYTTRLDEQLAENGLRQPEQLDAVCSGDDDDYFGSHWFWESKARGDLLGARPNGRVRVVFSGVDDAVLFPPRSVGDLLFQPPGVSPVALSLADALVSDLEDLVAKARDGGVGEKMAQRKWAKSAMSKLDMD